jgi:hypothetical protein
VQIECVNTPKELIEVENAKIALGLSGVTLANRDAATFLAVSRTQRDRTQELLTFSSGVDKENWRICTVAFPRLPA